MIIYKNVILTEISLSMVKRGLLILFKVNVIEVVVQITIGQASRVPRKISFHGLFLHGFPCLLIMGIELRLL